MRRYLPPSPAGFGRKIMKDTVYQRIETGEPATGNPMVAILTGGGDRHYAFGLAKALIGLGVEFDLIGSDDIDDPVLYRSPLAHVLNLRKEMRSDVSAGRKVVRLLLYYWRLLAYAATAKPKVFHILWNNKFAIFDRTLLMLYYRALGKSVALTVHNVNAGWRDTSDSFVNRLTLRIQYRLCDHLFVHTQQMRRELKRYFAVPDAKISLIPFGVNESVPKTGLTRLDARERLRLGESEKVLLFFGNIAPYKGLEFLIEAMGRLVLNEPSYRLVIAGRPKDCAPYWDEIQQRIARLRLDQYLIQRIEWVPDEDTEIYFKAADVLVLPYTYIFQSGVLFLAYGFGLPVIASDAGSMREFVLEGKTGFVFRRRNAADLVRQIDNYFSHQLYRELDQRRQEIEDFAKDNYSWTEVGDITRTVYRNLLGED
jgi:glycosyltransferase involved in cell wall biosynthesis